MTTSTRPVRPLGTMVAYGFDEGLLDIDLAVAAHLGATVLEILPDWRASPDPRHVRDRVNKSGFSIHSAHGCWGGQSILAPRVDLGSTDPATFGASVEDLKRCIDWLCEAGGVHLVVHPGGLSDPERFEERRGRLAVGLSALAEYARGTPIMLCVENMPPGVYPGSRMADLASLVAEIGDDRIGLALDTGHAHISASVASETLAAGRRLKTTHVHDNDGRHDSHLPPGHGSIDWDGWALALDAIGYQGPVMLECIRQLRKSPGAMTGEFSDRLDRLRRRGS